MDKDRISGAGQKLGGSAKDAVGGALGDTKLQADGKADKAAGSVQNALGGAKDAARNAAGGAQGEISRLGAEVDRMTQEPVTPALARTAEAAGDYVQRAKDTVAEQSARLSDAVKERPLLAVGLGIAAGYLVGRLMGGNTYVYPDR